MYSYSLWYWSRNFIVSIKICGSSIILVFVILSYLLRHVTLLKIISAISFVFFVSHFVTSQNVHSYASMVQPKLYRLLCSLHLEEFSPVNRASIAHTSQLIIRVCGAIHAIWTLLRYQRNSCWRNSRFLSAFRTRQIKLGSKGRSWTLFIM
jgi:hypothetical protein